MDGCHALLNLKSLSIGGQPFIIQSRPGFGLIGFFLPVIFSAPCFDLDFVYRGAFEFLIGGGTVIRAEFHFSKIFSDQLMKYGALLFWIFDDLCGAEDYHASILERE